MAQEKGPVRSLRRPTDSYRRQWDYTSTPSSVADDVVVAEEDDESRAASASPPAKSGGGVLPRRLLPIACRHLPASSPASLCRIWRREAPPADALALRHHLAAPPSPRRRVTLTTGGGREKRERESVDSRWMDKNMQGSSCGSARFYKTGTYNIS